ncbi:MAG: RNA polymerase factor sigma-54 [Robiginitomaculum sp.]
MAMSPQLKMRQSQSLVMTPQLQQAIKLLQLSNIELASFVEEQLESNPLLERGTGDENRRGEDEGRSESETGLEELRLSEAPGKAAEAMDTPLHTQYEDASPGEMAQQMAEPVQSSGGEIDWSKASASGGSFSSSGDYDAASNTAKEITLSEHLMEQLAMSVTDDKRRLIGAHLIDHVDENGYMRASIDEIAQNLGASQSAVKSMLTMMHSFEPTGVLARDLAECLSLQLRERGELDAPMQALLDNLPLLAKRDMATLTRLCGVDKDGLTVLVARLRSLSPKPGLAYGGNAAAVVEPDVFIREQPGGTWGVELNSATLPRVLVNSRYYAQIVDSSKDEGVKTFMTECQANASWLVKSLDQRARTILKVSTEIVKQQDGFFAYGIDHLRPLNLRTVADAIEMHESTVSRVTSNKYMATPRGTFELKYFFTSAIPALGGGEAHSAEAVRHRIKGLIGEETLKNVLSDDKIVDLLRAEGIDIARRTVAKYREALGIQSSVERRRMLKHAG